MNMNKTIVIKKARVHNLKNIDVEIPRNKLVVITGVSGSGKSSLAFDTLYAEGQRRYVESLSSYARQFLGRMNKPEVDFIKGIPPAIAIEQKVNTRNPRSTVGTSTEIYEYLKILFARVGHIFSPVSGLEVKKYEAESVVQAALNFPVSTRLLLLSPFVLRPEQTIVQRLQNLLIQGYSRVFVNDKIENISDFIESYEANASGITAEKLFILIDRCVVEQSEEFRNRLTDSVESAFMEGESLCFLKNADDNSAEMLRFSKRFEADGITFETPSVNTFSFNNPLGACPLCEGFGKVIGIDEDLVIPNKSLSIYQDAIVAWRGETMSEWKNELIYSAEKFDFPIHKPYYQLTDKQRKLLWTGNRYFKGLTAFFKYLDENQYKIQYRVMLARYRGKTVCPDCGGSRLKKEANYIKIDGHTISELVMLPIENLNKFFDNLTFNPIDTVIAKRLLTEITKRIKFLLDVGLGYLTLNRLSNSLSGGESQRINLVTSLGSSLVGSLYILDEPSIGLHPRDTDRLIGVLKQLRDIGNTVVVVEHDEKIMRASDYIIDIGPLAGRLGGEVVFEGKPPATDNFDLLNDPRAERSFTLKYLLGKEKIETPKLRRKWNNYIEISGACENNLKNLSVKFPLNVMTVITGVSGSGKSTLLKTVFYPALKKLYGGTAERSGQFANLSGSTHLVSDIELVDQNPIGKSTRSNPATYLKVFDEIRTLFAEQQLSRQMGYKASHFSFNTDGGRCEECQGEGTVTVEMQFMADLVLECEHCHGKRFKADILEVLYNGQNIYDILEMTVNQAMEFFENGKGNVEKRIIKRLKPLQDVGLGYIKLGQSSSTLSGGESQRVKLASFLANERSEPIIFVFDEPTTGLHFHDIKTLLKSFNALIDRGHTVIIIEHNMEVIKCADHIIDLGLEGGEGGGNIVFEGTPDALVNCKKSYTAQYL
ncbi:MAG: excinuclease ABC subunit UvrA [Paludibacter sp.]|nr:excinuclease ABC subunit UvrA [Paludibacter sp.]